MWSARLHHSVFMTAKNMAMAVVRPFIPTQQSFYVRFWQTPSKISLVRLAHLSHPHWSDSVVSTNDSIKILLLLFVAMQLAHRMFAVCAWLWLETLRFPDRTFHQQFNIVIATRKTKHVRNGLSAEHKHSNNNVLQNNYIESFCLMLSLAPKWADYVFNGWPRIFGICTHTIQAYSRERVVRMSRAVVAAVPPSDEAFAIRNDDALQLYEHTIL